MNNKDLMYKFIKDIEASKLTTIFICDILKYQELNDYTYIFRIKEESTNIIIDIYDNISINRFNRYIFHFSKPKNKNDITITEKNNVFVTDINVLNSSQNNDNNLVKLAYLNFSGNLCYFFCFLMLINNGFSDTFEICF